MSVSHVMWSLSLTTNCWKLVWKFKLFCLLIIRVLKDNGWPGIYVCFCPQVFFISFMNIKISSQLYKIQIQMKMHLLYIFFHKNALQHWATSMHYIMKIIDLIILKSPFDCKQKTSVWFDNSNLTLQRVRVQSKVRTLFINNLITSVTSLCWR